MYLDALAFKSERMAIGDSRKEIQDAYNLGRAEIFVEEQETNESLLQMSRVMQNTFLCNSIVGPQHNSQIGGFNLHPTANAVRIEAARNSQFLQFLDTNLQILQLETALQAQILQRRRLDSEMPQLETRFQMQLLQQRKRGIREQIC